MIRRIRKLSLSASVYFKRIIPIIPTIPTAITPATNGFVFGCTTKIKMHVIANTIIAYRKYRSSMEQRQKVVRTSGSPYSQQTAVQGKRQIVERSASTKRKRTREKGKPYYDYDLLLVIIFLMCFGLVMLYSSSAYSAQNDYNNDMFFFTRQAIIGIIGFIAMFIVSKIDYHLYGAYAQRICHTIRGRYKLSRSYDCYLSSHSYSFRSYDHQAS